MLTRIIFLVLLLTTACAPLISSSPTVQKNIPATQVEPPEGSTAVPSAEVQAELLSKFTRMAVEDLANRLTLDTGRIRVDSTSPVIWADAALGCPLPGKVYSRGAVPGYQIYLEADGQKYVYHTDEKTTIVFCGEQALPSFPVTPGEIDDGEPWMPVD